MLAYVARRQPGAEQYSGSKAIRARLERRTRTSIVMTGNVAQIFLTDADWKDLCDIRAALRPGGYVAFESRNPDDRLGALEPRGNLSGDSQRPMDLAGKNGWNW